MQLEQIFFQPNFSGIFYNSVRVQSGTILNHLKCNYKRFRNEFHNTIRKGTPDSRSKRLIKLNYSKVRI